MRHFRIIEVLVIILILVTLLSSGMMPQAVQAATGQKDNPESWLNAEEKAYVTAIRATDSTVRGLSANLTALLWGYNEQERETINQTIIKLRTALEGFNIKAPEEFAEIGTRYSNLYYSYLNKPALSVYIYSGVRSMHAGDLIANLASTENCLNSLEDTLDVLSKRLTAQIADIAERREKAAEMLEKLFDKYCFIATAAYGTPAAAEIDVLRRFRNEVLLPNPAGKKFVELYYEYSPPLAQFISEHERLRTITRIYIIDPIVHAVDYTETWWSR
jgi:hypothetical protein